jgi:hypothetical protein
MILLAHRGLWKVKSEQNTLDAFRAAFARGFGVELDVRDLGGELVISHDPPLAGSLTFADVLSLHADYPSRPVIAINIKADGLTQPLAERLAAYPGASYFCFDMSVPDALHYLRAGLTAFTRHSEYEAEPSFLHEAAGVWLDRFVDPWVNPSDIIGQLSAGKRVAVVSPELHRKPHLQAWGLWRAALAASALPPALIAERLMLCTDFPDEAQAFFGAGAAGARS